MRRHGDAELRRERREESQHETSPTVRRAADRYGIAPGHLREDDERQTRQRLLDQIEQLVAAVDAIAIKRAAEFAEVQSPAA